MLTASIDIPFTMQVIDIRHGRAVTFLRFPHGTHQDTLKRIAADIRYNMPGNYYLPNFKVVAKHYLITYTTQQAG